MGAGRAAEFDDEITVLGSVIGRSSGPVDAAGAMERLQQITTGSANNRRIRIPPLFNKALTPDVVGLLARWYTIKNGVGLIGAIDIPRILRSGKTVGVAEPQSS